MDLIQVGSISQQKEEEVIDMIKASSEDVISIRSINQQTGISYDYIKKIAMSIGCIIKKKPFPSHVKRLCVIKQTLEKFDQNGGESNENKQQDI